MPEPLHGGPSTSLCESVTESAREVPTETANRERGGEIERERADFPPMEGRKRDRESERAGGEREKDTAKVRRTERERERVLASKTMQRMNDNDRQKSNMPLQSQAN